MNNISNNVKNFGSSAVTKTQNAIQYIGPSLMTSLYKTIFPFAIGFSVWEIGLNILFICIIIISSMILYWDSINRQVSKTSRCKRQMDIFNRNKGIYIINATDKTKKPLYTISYDTNQKNINIECACKTGNFVNEFNGIKIKNMRTNKDIQKDKVCSCDKFYNTGVINENILYDGEPGVVRYMTTGNSDFFDNVLFSEYSTYAGYN